jgi:hypothetical protein
MSRWVRVNENALYLRTIEDLRSKASSHDAYELLRGSALVRQLILDDPPLAHFVNRNFRVKLQFRVVEWEPCPLEGVVFSWVDVSSDRAAPWSVVPPRLVKQDAFLATKCLSMEDQVFTVKDVIKSCANFRGGVHKGNRAEEADQALAEFDRIVQVGGMDATVNLIRGIAKCLLVALEPLTEAVRSAAGGTRTHGS